MSWLWKMQIRNHLISSYTKASSSTDFWIVFFSLTWPQDLQIFSTQGTQVEAHKEVEETELVVEDVNWESLDLFGDESMLNDQMVVKRLGDPWQLVLVDLNLWDCKEKKQKFSLIHKSTLRWHTVSKTLFRLHLQPSKWT